MTYAQAPAVEYVQAAPQVQYVQEAPQMQYIQEAPQVQYVQEAPQVQYVQEAPQVQYVQAQSYAPQTVTMAAPAAYESFYAQPQVNLQSAQSMVTYPGAQGPFNFYAGSPQAAVPAVSMAA